MLHFYRSGDNKVIVETEAVENFGPAMAALTPQRRVFVRIVLDHPLVPQGIWARKAGFGGPKATPAYFRLQAHRLMHDQRILAALEEETWARVKLGGAIAIAGLIRIASDPKQKGHLQACVALADRAGFSPAQKVDVRHEHVDMTGAAIRKEIERLAARVGMDPVKLLGGNVVEGEFAVVEAPAVGQEVRGGGPEGVAGPEADGGGAEK